MPFGCPPDDEPKELDVHHDHEEPHDHDRGLAYDLSTLLDRRRTLKLLAGVGVLTLVGCASDSETSSGTSTSAAATTPTTAGSSPTTVAAATGGTCQTIPSETAGPFPGDGSNGPNVLTQSGIVRSDITSSFGSAKGVAKGVPLTINLTVVDTAKSCAALANAAVYLWHCDIDGNYSLYSQAVTGENYLRGVQQTDSRGVVSFKSIFPAAYSGRWPHIHFEVYPSVATATGAGSKLATSQLALPEDACKLVYATTGYSASVRNLAQTSLARDNVFSDGSSQQVATVTGDVGNGFTASLRVAV
jgi:protocatechuate 3,4-dioxygenase beta subunit